MEALQVTAVGVLLTFMFFQYAVVEAKSSCTSGFMDMDVILKTVNHESLAETGHLDGELRVVPNWNFTCSAYITSLLLGVRIRPGGESYPEVQTWRRAGNGLVMVENRSIILSPGNFSTDGIIRYHLTPPMPVVAGDMLGVYQPQHTQSIVQFYYIRNDADAPAAYERDDLTSSPISLVFEDKHVGFFENGDYILLSAITDFPQCSSGFLSFQGFKQKVLNAKLYESVKRERELRIFPDINFTCSGNLTKWIFGGESNRRVGAELQIWRNQNQQQVPNCDYTFVGSCVLSNWSYRSTAGVYNCIPDSPLVFEKGDILGVYQRHGHDRVKLTYQKTTGPPNYQYLNNVNTDPPLGLSVINWATRINQYDYPLVTVEIVASSTGIDRTTPIITPSPSIPITKLQMKNSPAVSDTLTPFLSVTINEAQDLSYASFVLPVSSTSALATTPLLTDISSFFTQTISPSMATAHQSSFLQVEPVNTSTPKLACQGTETCRNAPDSHCANNSHKNVRCNATLTQAEKLIEESPVEGLMVLLELSPDTISNTQLLRLLTRAFDVQSSRAEISIPFVETSIQIVDSIPHETSPDPRFLLFLDNITLSLRRNVTINTSNIAVVVQEVLPSNGYLQAIEAENSFINLPGELFEKLNGSAFVASYYFKNISHLLPVNDTRFLISPVISSVVSCIHYNCRTSNLSENVTIFFSLPPQTMKGEVQCVFADLQHGVGSDFWSNSGCMTVKFNNGSVMCSCNHLTHFAILLSPGVDEVPHKHRQALSLISQIIVSISLLFLLATILAYLLQKSLWNMRNYIHVMLCANLFAAQLLFVVGVNRTGNKAVCSAIAVLLHYMFLVVFMWMLMEGVVLYVALIKVFVKHRKRYIFSFTLASYGIPLAYMFLVVPLGFLVNTDSNSNHYGYYNTTSEPDQLIACWLRYDTYFVWAFIGPVVLIILINTGFLIMSLVVMYRHLKKQEHKSEVDTAKHWLKVTISLMVVMGIAWIGNLLFFNIHLLVIAYIMTIFIAGQGIIIFILFVPLSKQVREAYFKWWKIKHSQSEFLSKHCPAKEMNTSIVSSNKFSKDSDHTYAYGNTIALNTLNSGDTLKEQLKDVE